MQGVGFRYFVMRRAQARGLKGWVRNRENGSVELLAEGERADLEELLAAVREGPRLARVSEVDTDWTEATGGLDPFDLTY